ncbi:hypothetical protein ABBQ38_009534 [Trebouxia sp. C0009 RCD-2024]
MMYRYAASGVDATRSGVVRVQGYKPEGTCLDMPSAVIDATQAPSCWWHPVAITEADMVDTLDYLCIAAVAQVPHAKSQKGQGSSGPASTPSA